MATEFQLTGAPVQNRQRLYYGLNPNTRINNTVFVPPSLTDDRYVIPDGTIGVAVQLIEILDGIENGSIQILGNGRLVLI